MLFSEEGWDWEGVDWEVGEEGTMGVRETGSDGCCFGVERGGDEGSASFGREESVAEGGWAGGR